MRDQENSTSPTHTGTAASGQDAAMMGFPDEVAYLEEMKQALEQALLESNAAVERYDREYREQKQYIVEYRHEIDPKEIFQNQRAMQDMERTGEFAVKLRDQIAKLVDSPYFAHIDFQTKADGIPSALYIGRFAFAEDEDHIIYDWRAPISSMFYDCEVGKAGYQSPTGGVEGELSRKRQFRITKGEMEYCLESSVNIQDDVLQRELSRTADEKMKTIISTIQKEQNGIIRNEQAETLVIQGVAGSGKTSIALHRIAYLLYRYKDRLTAKNVVIVSPNQVFGDYIANVLPELGEEPIYEITFEDIAHIQLEEKLRFQPACDPVEIDDPQLAERIRFKSSLEFLQQLDRYLAAMEEEYFEAADYTHGTFIAPKDYIRERYRAYHRHPVKRRLQKVAEDILDYFQTRNPWGEKLPQERSVLGRLNAMLRVKNTMALYKGFYRWLGRPELLVLPEKNTLEWADVYPCLYVQAAFEGLQENKIIRHLVIDEMQDYTPVQYAVMNLLFRCKKTILGDYGQVVHPYQECGLEDFDTLYPGVEIVRLNTSYRSTFEIITFARGILGEQGIEPIERHGDEVETLCCRDENAQLEAIRKAVSDFRQSGYTSMGIILKTARQAEALYRQLKESHQVNLLHSGSERFTGGVSITSIRMSKGLEFDQVLVPFADETNYHSGFDRNLLYIACTRAMHKLSVSYTGTLTPLIEAT